MGGGKLASEIGVKWEIGLKDRGKWDVEVGGINANYINNSTNYINSISHGSICTDHGCPKL